MTNPIELPAWTTKYPTRATPSWSLATEVLVAETGALAAEPGPNVVYQMLAANGLRRERTIESHPRLDDRNMTQQVRVTRSLDRSPRGRRTFARPSHVRSTTHVYLATRLENER